MSEQDVFLFMRVIIILSAIAALANAVYYAEQFIEDVKHRKKRKK